MRKTENKTDEQKDFDVIIVGGGPSGSSCATFLGKLGKKVLLIDRAIFPRDKTCGDGISGKSVRILNELGVIPSVTGSEHIKMYGVAFSSPNGTLVDIKTKSPDPNLPPGFVCRREVFDNILLQNAKKYCTVMEGFFVTELLIENGAAVGITGNYKGTQQKFSAKIIVGADGASSLVAKKTGAWDNDEEHQVAAVRAYYTGVKGMGSSIELHFVKEAIPGYFWVFPLSEGKANVGIGMLIKDMQQKKVNLQKTMFDIIDTHPVFKERFKEAKRISEVKSWLLPLGSKRRKVYGNGYLLVGDAASLIDPFTGEGIGNALVSGKIASEVINEAFLKNDFSESALSAYQTKLFEEVGDELKTSYRLQKLAKHNILLNFLVGKAARSEEARSAISSALLNPEAQKQFHDPMFYLKILLS